MKKILLSLFLVLCIIMSTFMVACDNDKDGEKNDNKVTATDDPNKNIEVLVAKINEGVDFEALLNETTNNKDIQAELDKAMDQVKALALQAAVAATYEGETNSIYIGMKDGSCVADLGNGGKGYSFIEDDWKIVGVGEYNGQYEGEVITEYAEMIEMLSNPVDITEDDDVQMVLDVLNGITLPKIAKANIKYEDGKYIFDNDYLLSVVDAAIEGAWNFSVEQNPELAEDEEALQEAKDMIASYVEKIDFAIYCYMKNEAFTGIGAKVELDPEFASEMMGYSTVKALVELNTEFVNVDVEIADGDDIVIDAAVKMTYSFDKDGMPKSLTVKADVKAPYGDYKYDEVYNEEWDEYYTEEICRIEGYVNVKADVVLDLSKSENGEFFKADASMTKEAGKAYTWSEDTYEYEYSEELTKEFGGESETVTLKANATAKNGKTYTFDGVFEGVIDGEKGKISVDLDATVDGKSIDGTMVATMEANGEKDSVEVTVGADLDSAPDFPEIPAGVQEARQEALEEYNMYN